MRRDACEQGHGPNSDRVLVVSADSAEQVDWSRTEGAFEHVESDVVEEQCCSLADAVDDIEPALSGEQVVRPKKAQEGTRREDVGDVILKPLRELADGVRHLFEEVLDILGRDRFPGEGPESNSPRRVTRV